MDLKLDKNNLFLKIYLKKIVVLGLVLSWIFTGLPQIFDFPPTIQETHAATTTLRPNGAGTYQQWETLVGSSHWEATSDQSDTSYIEDDGTNNLVDIQALQDPTFSNSSTVNSITIYARIYTDGSAVAERVTFFDRLGTTDRETGSISITRDSFNEYNSGSLTVDPDGVAWTKTSISALEAGVKDTVLSATEMLRASEIWISVDYTMSVNNAPDTPTITNPSRGSEIITLTPTLSASTFSDPDEDTHVASQWQMTTTFGNYTSPVFDSGEDAVNLTSIVVSQELDYNVMYFWRVRYKDSQGGWSAYSSESSFYTSIKGVAVSIEIDGGGEYGIGETAVIIAQISDSIGAPINSASTTLAVFDPTKTKVLDDAPMTYITDSNGLYYYDYPITAPVGVYIFHIETLKTESKLQIYSTGIIHVAPWIQDIENTRDAFVAASGTAESGTVSTLIDSSLTEPDDFWNSMTLVITSGTNTNEIRYISDFNSASSTLTVDEPFSFAISSSSEYLIRKDLDFASRAASAVWDESRDLHTATSTFGYALQNPVSTALDVAQAVWEYSSRTLTDFGSLAADVWDDAYAPVRKLTSRQIGEGEYLVGVTVSSTVTQVADKPTQDTIVYDVELIRAATFDFAGFADSGTTLTLVDLELEQPDDYWNNYRLRMMSGSNFGEERRVSSFDAASDTITLSSAFTNAIANDDKYVLLHEDRLVYKIWNATARTLTNFGTLTTDIWSDISAPVRRLTDKTLTGGGSLATETYLDTIKSDLISEIDENQTLISTLNDISAADVWSYAIRDLTGEVDLTSTSTQAIWDVAKSELTTAGSIGKQVADNLDVVVSTRSTLTAADVWSESTRTLTDYATSSISVAVWSEATRELTEYGNDITAADVWDVLSSTLTLEDSIGKQLTEGVDVAVSTRASQVSLDVLNDISAADVWSYADRSITDPDAIWEYALTQIGDTGSVGKLLKDNIDASVSSRSSHTAADVWNATTRTLTSNDNFNDPDSATIASAVWSEATRELTEYGNDITAADVWNVLSSNLTTNGSIGKQLAVNVDVAVSTRSTLTAADVWGYENRSLTNFGTLVADIWGYSIRTLSSVLLGGGEQLATQSDVTVAKDEIIALINALNDVSTSDVWAYSNRSLTDPDAIWEYALTEIGDAGSIGLLLKDNIDATISSRATSTLTASDVWNAAVRTLTSGDNIGISTTEEIADAIWDEAIADHAVEGSTGAALSTASAGGGGDGAGGLVIETHTVSEFEQGDTAAAATVQVKNNGVPVTGATPTGVYYDPDNVAKTWPDEGGSTVNFTEIGSTGIYTHNFDTTSADLGVYKLAVQTSQSSGGSNYTNDFESDTVDQDADGWANTGATYIVKDEGAPQNKVYRKSNYGGFIFGYAISTTGLADITYTAKVRMDTLTPEGQNAASDYVGITFRYIDSGNNYIFYFRRGAGNVRLMKHTNGGTATLQETASYSLTVNKDTWYTMKVVVTGGNIKGYVDNVLQIDYTDTNPHEEGMIGVFTYNSVGSWDDFNVTSAGTSQYAYVAKDFAIVSPKSTLTAQDVWDVATSSLTTIGSIGKTLADNRTIQFKANGEVLAGSGANNYRAKLYISDLSSQPVNAVSTPTITLYDSTQEVATGPTAMTEDLTGVYSYQYTIGASVNAGRWEAVANVNTGGATTTQTSSYFEVESAPARVAINSITDNTVPSITANIEIANEGGAPYEYQYEYCVVDTIENICGGGDDIAYALSAEEIDPGEENKYVANKTLTVNEIGTYWYKLAVYWGTEKSVAVLQFDARSESEPDTPGGGGGGGGIITFPMPPIASQCSGADFNLDNIVNSIDFSILLYFWKINPPFRNPCVDVNKDNQVNSIDFSIMLYQWGKPGTNVS